MTCSIESFDALTQVWLENQYKTDLLPIGLNLWHCGDISSLKGVDPNQALFATQDYEERMKYANDALRVAKCSRGQATLLSMQLKQQLKCANFNKKSLVEFCNVYCQHHPDMVQTICQWCLDQELDGVISLNGGADEVFIVRPLDSLAFLNFEPI